MGKYGPGLTFGQVCNFEKEHIKHALRGEIEAGEDQHGFIYEPGTKEECEQAILAAYDAVVFQAEMAMCSGRTIERMYREVTGKDPDFRKYIRINAEEAQKFSDYKYGPGDDA